MKTAQRRGKRASGRSGLGSGVRESSKCLGNRSELSRAMAENLRWKMALAEVGEVSSCEEPHTLN